MSQSVLVSTIQERVRTLCELPAFSADTQVSTAIILDYVKTAATLLAGLAKSFGAELYMVTSGALTTAAGVAQVSLPTNFSDLVRVSWLRSAQEEYRLELANSDQWIAYPNNWGAGYPVRYRLVGSVLELYPTPDKAYSLRVYYTTGVYVTATSDVIECRDGWDQWIVLQCCLMVRSRQQRDGSEFAPLLQMLDDMIRREMRRDKFGSRQIKDRRSGAYGPAARNRLPWL